MKRALFFDLDGTLTDPNLGITRCIRHALEGLQLPVPPAAELERWIGPPLAASFREHLGPEREALVARAVALYRERFSSVGLFENVLYPEVGAALGDFLAVGRRLCVVTSKPTLFARRILEHFDLLRYFACVYGSELSGERSDKAELVRYALDCERLQSADVVMIGDREHDVRGARRNGVTAVGVLWGFGSEEELLAAGANHVVRSFAELSALVAGFE